MSPLSTLYRHSLALLTDLYQLTMAYGYWKSGRHEREAVFHLYFRKNPFEGPFALAAGLDRVIEFITQFQFSSSDLAFLRELRLDAAQGPLWEPDFLDYLEELRLDCSLDAVPEGTVVFAHEPVLRVRGPLLQCQLLETPLLNFLNFPTLIATKAARVCQAAAGDSVLEFGLRRAQGIDGALSASRAAYIGGCSATSNLLAAKLFGIPPGGTHAHSWVLSFQDELSSFREYARAMPSNCIFLVDTYDSEIGIKHAIQTGRWLEEKGHRLGGIRLDSGDLAELSKKARVLLDRAGFSHALIVASGDLDEGQISRLKKRGAAIAVWGVGTRLATGAPDAALTGVYKLSTVRNGRGDWVDKLKLSEEKGKMSFPGILQIRRYRLPSGELDCDVIYDRRLGIGEACCPIGVMDNPAWVPTPCSLPGRDLLQPVFDRGKLVYASPPLVKIRERAAQQVRSLPVSMRKLQKGVSPVRLDEHLFQLLARLEKEERNRVASLKSGSGGPE